MALWVAQCSAADGRFYQRFLSILGTNQATKFAIVSPALVDTNNTGFKLTNGVVSFSAMTNHGEVAGVRLGMGMEQVVATLGKPPVFWSTNRFGGPCFEYSDLTVVFELASNTVRRINLPDHSRKRIRFAEGVSGQATVDEWVRVMGEPSSRGVWTEYATIWLAYFHSDVVASVYFDSKTRKLKDIWVQRPTGIRGW